MVEIGAGQVADIGHVGFARQKKTKHVLVGTFRLNPWGDFLQFLCECARWPLAYISGFIQIRSDLESYNRKTLPRPTYSLQILILGT